TWRSIDTLAAAVTIAATRFALRWSRAMPRSHTLDVLDELLDTLTDTLDIRERIERVRQVVQDILPHDVLGVAEISTGGERLRLIATAGPGAAGPAFELPLTEQNFVTKPRATK